MIDKQSFATGMGLLCGNFNRTLDAAVSRAYYGVLSSKLTTEQFTRAVELSLAEDTFWPSAASLIQKVAPPSAESDGLMALEHVNRVMSEHGGHLYLSHEVFHREFDAPTKAAISAVGGLSEITGTPIERHPGMAKRFAAAYAKSLQPRIAAAPIDGRVLQLVNSTVNTLSGRDRAAGRDE